MPSEVTRRLAELGLVLPPAARPVGSYSPAVAAGPHVWVSGQCVVHDGVAVNPGTVDEELDIPTAQRLARQATLQGLSAIAATVGGLDRIQRIARVGVFVASSPGFVRQHEVANGASDLIVELFPDESRPARVSVGVAALPLNAPVEVELLAVRA
ncbi:MAG TPA: RidA family protein [Thermoplasmata archaeon]|nr:RidA family protein [Thermoplasmata archaeon]